MNRDVAQTAWWELHLRKARGEQLSAVDQQRYDAELARQDEEVPVPNHIETLKEFRGTAVTLSQENAQLRLRIERLEKEIRTAEQALSRQTRELLGIGE